MEKKANTAAAIETAKDRASSNVKMEPVNTPGVAPGTPRATAEGKLQEMGRGLEASEKKELGALDSLEKLGKGIVDLTGGFDRPYFGPAAGRWGNIKEGYLGGYGITPEEGRVRREINNLSDYLLRARSGAQINEQEYARLARFLPQMDMLPHMNQQRMAGFLNELNIIRQERLKYQGVTRGEVGGMAPKAGPKATHRFNPVTGQIEPIR